MTTKATCIIIGAGCIGCSIAFHLAELGMKDILILEKEFIAGKATGICPGGIRQQWSNPLGCQLSKLSVQFFKNLQEALKPGNPLEFIQSGYLFLAYSENVLETYRKNVALQNHHGINSQIVTPRKVNELVPDLAMTGIVGGAYCAEDGFLEDSHGFTQALFQRARDLGVRLVYDEAIGLNLEKGRILGVTGRKGEYLCDYVVNAAGCDAPALSATVGVKLPIVASKRRLVYTNRVEEHFLGPCVVSLERAWGAKQLKEGHVYLAYLGDDAERLSDYEFTERSVALGLEMIPRLGELGILRIQEGFYDLTPDQNPVLGSVDGINGYFHATGFSGHGFMLSPAVGRVMAQLITGRTVDVDLSDWHFDRFQKKELPKETMVL
jgi:sarcosine oxidase subunit beta